MLESQIDQHERRAVLRNDASVREQEERRRMFADQSLPNQATTFAQFAQADADTPHGRFTQVAAATVVGATAIPNYPPAASHQADPCGQEPALGYRINDLNPSDPVEVSSFTQQATGEPPSLPSASAKGVEVGSPSLSRPAYRRF
jgi:hypothetical protein